MEVAGLAIGAISMVTAWNACVQAFDTVSSARRIGFDHEIIQVKLEVERVRLLAWGEMVGLAIVQPGQSDPDRILDPRLNREDMRGTILKLLGCIQHVFNDTESLQRKYGLKRDIGATTGDSSSTLMISPNDGQLVLSSIFKRAYTSLQKSAMVYQQKTPLKLKARWAIGDRTKFLDLVAEIRGFNDSLVSLFPDITSKTAERLREDIDASDEVDSLQLLEQASVDGHEEIWESASMRLSNLGATATGAPTASLADNETETSSIKLQPVVPRPAIGSDAQHLPEGKARELSELEKQLDATEVFRNEKNSGTLSCEVMTGYPRASAWVHWTGDTGSSRYWDDELKGFVTSAHGAFDIYWKKKFTKKIQYDEFDMPTDEDYVFLDVEADPKYNNIRPGTITVEGFGMEHWEYEEKFGEPRSERILVSAKELPTLPAKKLLRRIHELKTSGPPGWNPAQEMEDLVEFGMSFDLSSVARWGMFSDFYMMLNRSGLFIDFATSSSVMLSIMDPNSNGVWNFLWQVILGYELARRLAQHPGSSSSGFTRRIATTLIVADQWMHNVNLILVNQKETEEEKGAREALQKQQANALKEKGNEAIKKKDFKAAIEFYTDALDITPKNPVFLSNRAAAYISIQQHELACNDAQEAVDADPTFSKAWGRLGLAKLELGDVHGSMDAYKRGMASDSKGGSVIMKQGYENAKKRLKGGPGGVTSKADADGVDAKSAVVKGKGKQVDAKKDDSAPWDDVWDLKGKTLEWHSLVHEKQVEGLLRFAEILKWPFINETRDFAEDIYRNLRSGHTVAPDIWDWIFGMVLPGRWAAFKIFAVLVLSTPSLSKDIETAHYFDVGLSLPKQSYWRSRTVLGRVLGSLPGVKFACGWLGPCPPVESPHRKYIRIQSRRVAPPKKDSSGRYIRGAGHGDDAETARIREGEDVQQWMAELMDESNWATPQPPVQQMTNCSVECIRLKKLPLDINVAARSSQMSEAEIDQETEYRASIEFKIDNEPPVTYTLYTNPVFVTLPPCKDGQHPVHTRELAKFRRNILNVEDLKDAEASDYEENGLIVINATGRGAAETLARAWCSERGKNAVVRSSGGPCFVCAYNTAHTSLGIEVLIWVS